MKRDTQNPTTSARIEDDGFSGSSFEMEGDSVAPPDTSGGADRGHAVAAPVCVPSRLVAHVVLNRVKPRRVAGSRRPLRARLWAFLVTPPGKTRKRLASLPMGAHSDELTAFLARAEQRLDEYRVAEMHRGTLRAALRLGPVRHGFLAQGAVTEDRLRERAREIAAACGLVEDGTTDETAI